MDKLLKFMEFAVIDQRLYWRIPSREGQELFEIMWRRDDKIRWRVRKLDSLLWELCSDASLLATLEHMGIDAFVFEQKLKSTLLDQVAYADRIVQDAKRLFGDLEVNEALDDHRLFMQKLEESILSLTQIAKRPVLKLVRSPDDEAINGTLH